LVNFSFSIRPEPFCGEENTEGLATKEVAEDSRDTAR
jgi:hypothetical protein